MKEITVKKDMKEIIVKISVINPDYNAEYEKEYGWLERLYENPKYDYEISWGIKDLNEYRYRENIEFELLYSYKNKRKHAY